MGDEKIINEGNTKMEIENLVTLAEIEGYYQRIDIKGETIVQGYRSCEDRWKMIEPHVHGQQTVLDIGSHYGYFGVKLAEQHENSLILSMESDDKRSLIQKKIIELNELDNMLLSETKLDLLKLLKLQRTCENFDMILAFSVIHYFPVEEIPEIIRAFSQLAQNLIIEVPHLDEIEVANRDLVQQVDFGQLLESAYDSVKVIGISPSPKHPDIYRKVYLAQNHNIKRLRSSSYWDARVGKKHTISYSKAEWKIDNKSKKYTGINLANLREFNIVHPDLDKYFKLAAREYYELIQQKNGKVTDIHPRNVIIAPNGVHIIDYKENLEQDIYGLSWEEYTNTILSYDVEYLEEALKDRFYKNILLAVGGKE